MPRPPRIQFPGATYHVMNRGVRGEPLYADDAERERFLRLLSETCKRYDWLLSAYCLMTNHYHLLVTTLRPTLSRGMQWLNSCWVQTLNRSHGHTGHGFFRRFHAVLLESDSEHARVARYILLNPVRAALCRRAEDWRWSSYRSMIGLEPAPAFLATHRLVNQFGLDHWQAQANFAAFIRAEE
jgi:putative transposase